VIVLLLGLAAFTILNNPEPGNSSFCCILFSKSENSIIHKSNFEI